MWELKIGLPENVAHLPNSLIKKKGGKEGEKREGEKQEEDEGNFMKTRWIFPWLRARIMVTSYRNDSS